MPALLIEYNPQLQPRMQPLDDDSGCEDCILMAEQEMHAMVDKQDQSRLAGTSPDVEQQDRPCSGSAGGLFEIHVKGHLDSRWSDWLEGFEMKLMANGEMILLGPVVDQSALLGILNKLSRLNLTLLSVNEAKNREGSKEE